VGKYHWNTGSDFCLPPSYVSVAPDVAVSSRKLIAFVEKKLLLSQVIDG